MFNFVDKTSIKFINISKELKKIMSTECMLTLSHKTGNAIKEREIIKTNHTLREGNGTPLQYSCPENPMDRGAW